MGGDGWMLAYLANGPWVVQSRMYRIVACVFLGHSKFQVLSFACRKINHKCERSTVLIIFKLGFVNQAHHVVRLQTPRS